MSYNTKRILMAALLTLALTVSLNVGVFPINAQELPKVFVVPDLNIFSTETTVVGDTFTVNISTSGWEAPGVFGWQVYVGFDPALLNVTKAFLPADHFLSWLGAGNYFGSASIEEDHVILYCITLVGTEGSTGSGVLATVNFTIIEAPPMAKSVSCDLTLYETSFIDPDGVEMPHELEHGYYEFAAPRPPYPQLKVEPDSVTAKEIGDQVTINVTIQDVYEDWRIVGVQWKLRFNSTLLEGLEPIIEGDYLKSEAEKAAAETGDEYGTYFYAIWEEDYCVSFTLYYVLPEFTPEIFPGHYTQGGTLATITFNVTYKPTFIDMLASCDLLLEEILIIDADGNDMEYEPPVKGFYYIAIAAPPWLSVEPKEYTASALGDDFDLRVFVNELEAEWKMVGAEFKIRYNLTMLELTNITEGGFMKHFAMLSGVSEPYTWFQFYVEEDPTSGYGIVGVIILPLENGTWPGPFPDTEDYGAPGDLAIARFKAIYQDPDLDLTSDIYLDEILLANTAGTEIPYNATKTAEEGLCKYTITAAILPFPEMPKGPIPPIGRFVDVFTEPFNGYPYNGRGNEWGLWANAFAPQQEVSLYALVTYNRDPVFNKPVTFKIYGPEFFTERTGFTDPTTGVATVPFRIPSENTMFGIWRVTVLVDVAEKTVNDTVYFQVGWLINTLHAEVLGNLSKLQPVHFEATVGTMSWLPIDGTLSVVVFDELGVPVFCTAISVSFAGVNDASLPTTSITDVNPNPYGPWLFIEPLLDVPLEIGIPITAFAGNATIHICIYDNSGVPICPEYIVDTYIDPAAVWG